MIFNMVGGGGGSSTKSTIIVSIETGSTVAAYSDSSYQTIVKTASEKTTGEYWLTGLDNGTYYIKATKSGDVATTSYTINEYGVYRITMAYFQATITVTYPTAATSLTLTDGTKTYTASDFSSGTYTFTVENAGAWTATAVVAGYSMTADFEVTASGQAFSDSCKLIIVNGDYYNANALGGWHGLYTSVDDAPNYIVNTTEGIYINKASSATYRYIAGEGIDLTPFSTFHARGYRDVSSSSAGYIGVSDAYNFSSSSGHITSTTIGYSSSGVYSDYAFDLTNYTSTLWLFFGASGTARLYLSELWIE